jgi:uncharacterized delta-60 repeat protein
MTVFQNALLCAVLTCAAGALSAQEGTNDPTFNPGTGASTSVYCTVVRPDGKVLLAGDFTQYDGVACHHVVRVNQDGSRDATFTRPTNTRPNIRCIAVQPDGKIITGGQYTTLGGYPRVERMNADGSLDPAFSMGIGGAVGGPLPTIESIALQPDGKVICGGFFTSYNGGGYGYFMRLNGDGTVDTDFQTLPGASNGITAIALQGDGKIIMSGAFTTIHGIPRNYIARLNTDGSVDTTFHPGTGLNHVANAISIQPDGKIILGGRFTQVQGVARNYLARLNADGSLDTNFDPGPGTNYYIWDAALQPDGRIVIGGQFIEYDGMPRSSIARVMPDGALDVTFDPGSGASPIILSLGLQPDGRIMAGGSFLSYNGTGRNRIARIKGTARAGIRVMLDGPYNGGLMSDALRTLPTFPLTEPFTSMGYSGATYVPGATIPTSVLSVTGNNAIVDWVLVEMRPAATPSVVAASRAVLLQRDGDVVELDGVSTVGFAGLAPGSYSVAVRPRNHLPVMLSSSTPIVYGDAIASVDLTLPGTQVHDNDAHKNVSGVMVLIAGDITFDGTVKYAGRQQRSRPDPHPHRRHGAHRNGKRLLARGREYERAGEIRRQQQRSRPDPEQYRR